MTVRLYTHPKCLPCKTVKKMLAQDGGKLDGEEVVVVDISTEKGFEEFNREVLSKGDGVVPSAIRGSQQCKVLHDHNEHRLHLDCPKEKQAET